MNNNIENNKYEENKSKNDDMYNKINKSSNSIIKVSAIIVAIISIIAMIYFYKDFGIGVIFIPIVLELFIFITYLKQRITNKLFYDYSNNLNKYQNSNETNDNEKSSSRNGIISYLLLGLSGISLLLISPTKGNSIYLTIILYIIGLILSIYSVVKNPRNKSNKTLLIVYICLTIIIILFISSIIGWINSWKGIIP